MLASSLKALKDEFKPVVSDESQFQNREKGVTKATFAFCSDYQDSNAMIKTKFFHDECSSTSEYLSVQASKEEIKPIGFVKKQFENQKQSKLRAISDIFTIGMPMQRTKFQFCQCPFTSWKLSIATLIEETQQVNLRKTNKSNGIKSQC